MESVAVKANEINQSNVEDALRTFPYLERSTVMDNRDAFLNRHMSKQFLFSARSSGSSGQGIVVWRSKADYDIESAFFDYEWGKIGYDRRTSRVVRIGVDAMRMQSEVPWTYGLRRLMISPYHLNQAWIEPIYERVVAFAPYVIHSYPSALEELANFIVDSGRQRIRCVGLLLSSESLVPHQIRLFRQSFDATIVTHYGLCERTNLAFGRFENDGEGLSFVFNPVYSLSENFEHEDGYQEIVGTSYWFSTMPLIRYRTQDFGKIEHGIARSLLGRKQEFLVTAQGNLLPGIVIYPPEFVWEYIRQYQYFQSQPGRVILRIVPKREFGDDVRHRIVEDQQSKWGSLFSFDVQVAGVISLDGTWKSKRIVSTLAK